MKIGFTGTRDGMTAAQRATFHSLIRQLCSMTEFHHGDCRGSDRDAHYTVMKERPLVKIVIHPPLNDSQRAHCEGGESLPGKDYIARNHDIVDSVDWLIAVPRQIIEKVRSGTWATIRYAKKKGKGVVIIYPNGGRG